MGSGREAGVRLRLRADRAEIAVREEVDISSEPALHEALDEAFAAGVTSVVFDYCGSAYVGGPAVRIALTALDRGAAVIVRGDRHVLRLFRVTGISGRVKLEGCG